MYHFLFVHLAGWFAQFMEVSRTGPTGVLAACPAVPGRRNDSGSATIPCLPMGGDTVQVRMLTQEAAKGNRVQVNVSEELPNTLSHNELL